MHNWLKPLTKNQHCCWFSLSHQFNEGVDHMLQFDMDALAAALEDEKTGSSKDAQMHADYLKKLTR